MEKKCVASFSGVPRKVFNTVSDIIVSESDPSKYYDVSVNYHGTMTSGTMTFEAWLHDYEQFWAVLSLFNDVYTRG